jgi:hypothetical protein
MVAHPCFFTNSLTPSQPGMFLKKIIVITFRFLLLIFVICRFNSFSNTFFIHH